VGDGLGRSRKISVRRLVAFRHPWWVYEF